MEIRKNVLKTQLTIFLAAMAGWLNRRQLDVINYLHAENEILKEQLEKKDVKLALSNTQRRKLAKCGKKLERKGLMQYASIVTPDQILYWHRKLVALKYTAKRKIQTDRQKEMETIREFCIKFAEENASWGYGRIQGAFSNFGYEVSETTVGNMLRAAGIPPSEERMKRSTWKQFVRSHMATMCVADFLTTEVWTMRGLVRYHTLFVMNLAKSRVQIAQISCQMNGQVMAQVARNLTDSEDGFLYKMEYFVCDNDPLFTNEFCETLETSGVKVIKTRVAGPEQNGYAERFVKSLKEECLDRMIFFGERSLRKAINEYVEHYHHERNHRGLDNMIPFPYASETKGRSGSVVKFERLGGLLNYYHRENGEEGRLAG
ncbi:integrase core domain-containing protein [Coraliomargarita sp. SDUM461003]|uniref:Integrase core domain-containing protein n=2 Tax=Thalassobacterium TaxID=3410851 RepID=A0ABU1AY76_9BACT|nr:integrase core domain-containing protein [Coraliomargarita sp. SDUM461003]MDQ8207922.1 integrase core domain-containing protein [Coraliomargarita sp. SDUM461003]